MRYLSSVVLILIALALGVSGILFKQFDLDVAAIVVALVAIVVFFWSSLHLSLRLRPSGQRRYDTPVPRSDEEQATALGDVIFRSKNDPAE